MLKSRKHLDQNLEHQLHHFLAGDIVTNDLRLSVEHLIASEVIIIYYLFGLSSQCIMHALAIGKVWALTLVNKWCEASKWITLNFVDLVSILPNCSVLANWCIAKWHTHTYTQRISVGFINETKRGKQISKFPQFYCIVRNLPTLI